MRVIADLHVHSKYARATSPQCDIPGLSEGAKTKGINIMATGDFTHPEYFSHIKNHLCGKEISGGGLYAYNDINFILSAEVGLTYEISGKNRRMHHVILAPGLEEAEQINDRLSSYGDLSYDGRPMLRLSSAELVDCLLEVSANCMVIPAHVWTPWFSLFGSRSGVDSVEEAFEDRAEHVHAIETGLSSDPGMNWMVSDLDRYTLVSNSDAHSPGKLGREANVLDIPNLSYSALTRSIITRKGFIKTYEFYPEEGKYHYDGHRKCGIISTPWESEARGNKCPACGKKITVGVLHRVADLGDAKPGRKPEGAIPYQHIVPLETLISKTIRKGESTKAVAEIYKPLIKYFGNEFAVYEAGDDLIRQAASPVIADSILKVKSGNIRWIPGHDGVFGELVLDERKNDRRISDNLQKSLGDFE
jgi:uncharacterized protein (TIGR00375 family)